MEFSTEKATESSKPSCVIRYLRELPGTFDRRLTQMRLAKFIIASIEPILKEWEAFASSLEPGATMTKLALRDDAQAILLAIARSMQEPQSLTQQASKSKGHGGANTPASEQIDKASARHAGERVGSAYDINEVVSEYRALRASVLRLWRKSDSHPDIDDLDDITRFNESLDQSLAEAVESYSERVTRSRQLFLAILAHDLRNPLYAIRTGAFCIQTNEDPLLLETQSLIGRASESMENLIRDMMDYASTWLGSAMKLNRKALDLHKLCGEFIDQFRMAHPQRTFHFHPRGDLIGNWDADRLHQVVSNLLGNALQHGSSEGPIELSVVSEGSTVVLSVHNECAPIPPEELPTLFNPLMRHAKTESSSQQAPGSVGLGLYIVREIAKAKGGTIAVTSTAQHGTTFTVRIPRESGVIGEESSGTKNHELERASGAGSRRINPKGRKRGAE